MRFVNLVGDRFGRLLVKAVAGKSKSGRYLWECVCDCGNIKVTSGQLLNSGRTKSCGCLMREICSINGKRIPAEVRRQNGINGAKHGHTGQRRRTPTYRSWGSMRDRCRSDLHYLANGTTICSRWNDFRNFLADMGERPYGTTLDRIDPRGNYEPKNCRWATTSQQNRNRRHAITARAMKRRALARKLFVEDCLWQ